MLKTVNFKYVALSVLAAAAVAISVFGLLTAIGHGSNTEILPASAGDVEIETSFAGSYENSPAYTLREYGGRVCVYSRENPAQPCFITDIIVSSLRDGDAQAVRHGIEVESAQALLMILEDLGS